MPINKTLLAGVALVVMLILAACNAQDADQAAATDTPAPEAEPTQVKAEAGPSTAAPEPLPDYEIVNLLPRDAIPAIFDPEFLSAEEANEEYEDRELVLGVEIDGDARAYSIPFLSMHEIVNDTVGGKPIAVTW